MVNYITITLCKWAINACTLLIHVFFPTAPPVWVTRPQDTRLEEGKPGYLHCQAEATPEPEVIWRRSNNEITSEVSLTTFIAYKANHHF